MLPMLEDLAQELSGKAEIVKFNCNARNKDLGKELNIKVAPTFHVYKNSNKVRSSFAALLVVPKENESIGRSQSMSSGNAATKILAITSKHYVFSSDKE